MAKEKTIELKKKVEKISEEHLKELRGVVGKLNQIQFNIGRIELQKHKALHDVATIEDKISLLQDTLVKEYGSYDVNLDDGKINWPEESSNEK